MILPDWFWALMDLGKKEVHSPLRSMVRPFETDKICDGGGTVYNETALF